jgi:hypothetical protein
MNPTVKSLILSDWAPHIEKTVRLIAVPIAACYVLGLMAGSFVHQLNDALAAMVSPRPHNPAAAFVAALEDPGPIPLKVQRQAVPSPRNVAAPLTRPSAFARAGCAPDPLAMALTAVREGSSQAAAARRFNVSRSTLRRRLKG